MSRIWGKAVRRYAVELVAATRTHPDLRLGASPRATLHLLRAAKATAALSGREFALPDDVQALAVAVLAHRLLPTAQAQLNRRTAEQVVQEILQRIPVPAAPQQGGFGLGRGAPAYGQQPPRRL